MTESGSMGVKRAPGQRIIGVETEFGCLVNDDQPSHDAAVSMVKDQAFYDLRLGVLDLHARDDVFEPAASGGFLENGARLYIDSVGSHLEYATAECIRLRDLIANDRAGQRIIVQALRSAKLEESVSFHNNSIDHFGGHTFGCHENYSVHADEDFLAWAPPLLYPFLVTRQIFAGIGRVGGHRLVTGAEQPSAEEMMRNPIDYIWVSQVYGVQPDDSVTYQLSQRADHIIRTMAGRVRFNRAIINPKWEHLYGMGTMQRVHLLFGEPNQCEYAYALKVGTTSLVLRLLEEERVPTELRLASPLHALRQVSRDESWQWIVTLEDGRTIRSVDLQRIYLELAQSFRGASEDTDWILREWDRTLTDLERDPMALDDRLDWVIKRRILETYMEEENLAWDDPALQSVDLAYHHIDPEVSLFHAWQDMGRCERLVNEADVIDAMTSPPSDTRAHARGALVRYARDNRRVRFYAFDWDMVALGKDTVFDLADPFDSYPAITESIQRRHSSSHE